MIKITLSRWVKHPDGIDREERVTVEVPIPVDQKLELAKRFGEGFGLERSIVVNWG